MPTPIATGGAPVSQNEYGYWIDAQGGIAATDPQGNPQVTPGMAANPQAALYYDDAKDLYYNLVNGQKKYLSPYVFNAQDPTGKGTGHGMTNPGGSLTQTGGTWNPDTGQFEQSTNWGNLLTIGTGAALGGGLLSALAGGGGAAASGAPTLEGVAAGPGAASVPVGSIPLGAIENTAFGLPASSAAAIPGAAAAPAAADLTGLYGTVPGGLGDLSAPGAVAGNVTGGLGAAAAGGSSIWDKIGGALLNPAVIGSAIAGGLGYLGASKAASASEQAAALNNQYLNRALDVNTQMYNQRIQNLQPYRSSGGNALGTLNSLMGLPAVPAALPAQPIPTSTGQNLPGPPPTAPSALGAIGQPAPGGQGATTAVRAPNGNVYQVPQNMLSQALQQGGTVINGV